MSRFKYRGFHRMVLLLVVFAGLFGGCQSDGVSSDSDGTTTSAPATNTTENAGSSDLEVIEAGVTAFYSGDAQHAAELFELSDLTDDEIRQEAAYQAAIAGRLTLTCSKQATPGMFTCNMPYHNAVTDAVGIIDRGDTSRVTVEDGVITEFSFPEHSGLMVPLASFIGGLRDNEVCEDQQLLVLPKTAECGDFIVEHLDEFAHYYETNS